MLLRRVAHSGGDWQDESRGFRFANVTLTDPDAHAVTLQHPAVIYFFKEECSPCSDARTRLNAFVHRSVGAGLAVYAITNDSTILRRDEARFGPGIRVARLTKANALLRFFRYIPALVRTDSAGRVLRTYVGIPKGPVFNEVWHPREANFSDR